MTDALQPVTDGDLAREARAGSPEAFGELVRRHEAPLLRYLHRVAGNRHDAEDLAQQAFLTAWRRLDRFDPARPFRTWIFTIARRLAIDAWRRRQPAHELPDDLPAPPAEDPSVAADLWETARATLGERSFTALWLMYGEGRSVAEISAMTGMSVIGVKVGLHRARRKLAGALQPSAPPHPVIA
jgi:RNA polymerase sigma-70 factor (ECF subfamily)